MPFKYIKIPDCNTSIHKFCVIVWNPLTTTLQFFSSTADIQGINSQLFMDPEGAITMSMKACH
jgi:hypothetical protein